jgi:hypothetical protein
MVINMFYYARLRPGNVVYIKSFVGDDHKPGLLFVKKHYQVFIGKRCYKFKSRSNEDLYNSVSMGI